MEAGGSREREARNYLEKHQIMELLKYLTSVLLFIRPGKRVAWRSAFCPTCLPSGPQKFPGRPSVQPTPWRGQRPSGMPPPPYAHPLSPAPRRLSLLLPVCSVPFVRHAPGPAGLGQVEGSWGAGERLLGAGERLRSGSQAPASIP